MYDRAQRNIASLIGSTTENVGPGTYDSEVIDPKKLRADGYAPFLSMTGRDTFLNPSDQVIAAPGPGQYDPLILSTNVKGGRTLANRSRRFDEPAPTKDTPGPGAYSLSKKADWIKEVGRGTASAPSNLEKNKGGSLMTNRIKFHRKPVAPSIPMPGQAYGYEENDDGTLRKQDPPEKDISLGPAFYAVREDKLDATTLYKGVHFGRLASKRTNFGGKEGPGPGEYEPYKGGAEILVEHLNMPEGMDKTRFDAKIPRYHELVVKDEEKKAVPGPGKYEAKSQFENQPPRVNTEGIEVEHPPFLSQAKRFGPTKSGIPAPGTYNDPRTALDSLKKITGLKRSPFGQTSVRFHGDRKPQPGPGAYNIPGMGSDSMRRAYIESTRRGGFGTTAVRIQPISKKESHAAPGPAHYQVKEKPFEPRYQQLSSNFASVSNRLTETPAPIKEIPPPGSYNVVQSFDKTHGKKEPANPRTEGGKKKHGAFQSSSSRFAPPRDVVIDETDPSYPGPGAYDPSMKDRHGNTMITKDNRFNNIKTSDTPGPGAYEFSPLIQDTVLRGTFNATLNNPIAAAQLDSFDGRMGANQPFLLGV